MEFDRMQNEPHYLWPSLRSPFRRTKNSQNCQLRQTSLFDAIDGVFHFESFELFFEPEFSELPIAPSLINITAHPPAQFEAKTQQGARHCPARPASAAALGCLPGLFDRKLISGETQTH